MRDVNPETMTGTLSWCMILPLNGFSLICAKKIFIWDGEKFVKILGAVAQTESWKQGQLDRIWESLWWSIMDSPHFSTSSIRDKWQSWKSRLKGKRRYFSSVATVRMGWKVLGCFYGVLLLSSKCPRPPGRRENSVWKTIWINILRTNNFFGAMVECHPSSVRDASRLHQFGKKVLPGIFSRVWIDRRREFGKEIFWLWTCWKIWTSWIHQKFTLDESTRKKYWHHKYEMNSYSQ